MPGETTKLNRIRLRRADAELVTTRLIGAGWTWDCGCGERGPWHNDRASAMESARLHRLYKHGIP